MKKYKEVTRRCKQNLIDGIKGTIQHLHKWASLFKNKSKSIARKTWSWVKMSKQWVVENIKRLGLKTKSKLISFKDYIKRKWLGLVRRCRKAKKSIVKWWTTQVSKVKENWAKFKQKSKKLIKGAVYYVLLACTWIREKWHKYRTWLIITPIYTTLMTLYVYGSINDYLEILVETGRDTLENFYFTAAGTTGAILAIVFTISTFALQSAARIESSRYFEIHKTDREDLTTYTLLVIGTVCFVVMGVISGNRAPVVISGESDKAFYISILYLIILFLVVARHYIRIKRLVNPVETVNALEREADDLFAEAGKESIWLLRIVKLKKEQTNLNYVKAKLFSAKYQHQLKDIIDDLSEVTIRFAHNYDTKTTDQAINLTSTIVNKFFSYRENTFELRSTEDYLPAFETESSNFISLAVERIYLNGVDFISKKLIPNSRTISRALVNINRRVSRIKFQRIPNENPILGLTMKYFKDFTNFAIKQDEYEITYEAIKGWRAIAESTVDENLRMHTDVIIENLLEFAIPHIRPERTFMVNEIINILCMLIDGVFYFDYYTGQEFDKICHNLKILIEVTYMAIDAGKLNEFQNQDVPNDIFYKLTNVLDKKYAELSNFDGDIQERDIYAKKVLDLITTMHLMIEGISKTTRICGSLLIASILFYIERTNSMLIAISKLSAASENKAKLLISRNMYTFWKIVEHTKQKELSNNFFRVGEYLTQFAIEHISDPSMKKQVNACIDVLGRITEKIIDKELEKFYDKALDHILNLAKIASAAISIGDRELEEKIVELIKELEQLYYKQCYKDGSEHRNEVREKILRWIYSQERRTLNTSGVLRGVDDVLADLITPFEAYTIVGLIWGTECIENPDVEEAVSIEVTIRRSIKEHRGKLDKLWE